MLNDGAFLPLSNLYGPDATALKPGSKPAPSTAETVNAARPVQSGPVMSWLAIVVVFILYRVIVEMGGSAK
jgi:hypothetical protein